MVRKKKLNYPTLYKTAKVLLSIPATSVPAERVFSLAGFICRKRRNRLTSGNVNTLIFLNKNFDSIPKEFNYGLEQKGNDHDEENPHYDLLEL